MKSSQQHPEGTDLLPWRSIALATEHVQPDPGIQARYHHWLLGGESGSHALLAAGRTRMEEDVQKGWEEYRRIATLGWKNLPELKAGRGPDGEITSHHLTFNVLFPLALDRHRTGNPAALEACLEVLDCLEANDFRPGSAKGRQFLGIFSVAAYAHSVALLRTDLLEARRLDRCIDWVLWYAGFDQAFRIGHDAFVEINADQMRCSLFNSLVAILSMPEGAARSGNLGIWKRWLETALTVTPSFAGVFKPDGIGYHHRGVYTSAYIPHAIEFAALYCYLLEGTPHALADEPRRILANALRTHLTLSQNGKPPAATRGRLLSHAPIPAACAYLALAEIPESAEMAAAFKNLWEELPRIAPWELEVDVDGYEHGFLFDKPLGRLELLLKAAELPQPARQPDEGFLAKPWGAMALHRRKDWLVSVKGWSQYVWDFEMHPLQWSDMEQNVFGRLASHGTLQTSVHGESINSGWDFECGWDWSRWPGTTCARHSLADLYDPKTSWACRVFSAATFVGAASCENRDGIFAMRLRDHFYEPGFHALKSWFFFDDKILCLGSNIESRDQQRPVETTLFQCAILDASLSTRVNGEDLGPADCQWQGEAGRPTSFLDPMGNGYVIPDSARLNLRQGEQISRDNLNQSETRGRFATCWIDHGLTPADLGGDEARYQYVLLPQVRPGNLEAEIANPSFRVLRCDHRAHAVRHLPTRTTAQAIFETDWLMDSGYVIRCDLPLLAIEREREDGSLVLSVADPDLRLPKRRNMMFVDQEAATTTSKPSVAHLLLRGSWQLQGRFPGVELSADNASQTSLTIPLHSGLTVEIHLAPIQASTKSVS